MRQMDSNGLALCRMQGRYFEASAAAVPCASAVFVRRFMNSQLASRMDSGAFLFESNTTAQVFEELDQEFGASDYGTVKFAPDELYWMGYLYRYWACAFEMRSARVFKCIGARELRELFIPYHSLDPEQAIRRIAEANGIELERDGNDLAVKALREIRAKRQRYEYRAVKLENK